VKLLAAILLPVLIGLAALQPIPSPAGPAARVSVADTFDHAEHASLFPTCTACHAGAEDAALPMWPSPAGCAACHDGEVEERVEWTGPAPRTTNLRFTHAAHAAELLEDRQDTAACVDCHAPEGARWMTVERATVTSCLSCHGVAVTHLAAPDSACATCHLPLSDAATLTTGDIEAFPEPPSHDEPGFAGRSGHGLLAWHPAGAAPGGEVAASCATCHARDFCIQCHVDAPEQPAIQALEPDSRSLVHQVRLDQPGSHESADFIARHGTLAQREPRECRTCHTQESCLACHAATPERVVAMARAGPDRARGALIEREPPETHTPEFLRKGHADFANARPETCAGCHVRQDCLDCHRPGAARASGYHPPAFLARHPTAAYQRETSCSDCHSTQQFCADCHESAGMVTGRQLTAGRFHDGKQFFVVGHGQAARQSLESCVTCHTERDCAQCHAATGARRFNPHGPGFDADRLRRRNPEPCRACHGVAIPGG
jgi:hypothetical protein